MVSIVDILIITIIVFFVYRFIRKTEAFKIIVGLLLIFFFYFMTDYMGLTYTATIFKKIFEITSFGLVLIFHQEIRMILKKLGGLTAITNEKIDKATSIEDAVFSMSESKTGALIIFDQNQKVTYQTEDMIKIGAYCSNELLETIFFKNSPLHDGAVIIQNGKIAFAGCKLPLTAKKREEYGHLGTRHLAALETAEMFDVTSIVVSEETGEISIATNKGIRKIDTREKFRLFFREKNTKNHPLQNIKGRIKDVKKQLKS